MNLQQAIEAQNIDEVIRILTENPPCIDEKTEDGVPLCLYAAKAGGFPIVKYIVEYSRASMNTVDEENRTILHYAAMSGDLLMNRYLVEKVGMDITAGDRKLVTPYQLAWEHGHKELLAYYGKRVGAAYEDMYHNPIRTGMFPDPSIVRVGEDYYMVNSSFIFFPCIPVSHSKDLIHWDIIGHAITNPKWARLDELEGGRGYWAPDISYDNGIFYITATYRLNDTGTVYRKQIVVCSDKPEGPYSEPAVIDEDGIDPSIFHEDGRHYMLLNRGARIFELSNDCMSQISETSLLYYGSQKRAPEGPHLLKKDGYYYLFLAEGGTGPGHRITVARSRELMGNYEPCPYNPIMRQTDEKAGLQRCGHGKPVCTQNGEWYMVYLCGRRIDKGYSILGRETALDPITWTQDGWPIVNNLKGPSVLQIKPALPTHVQAQTTQTSYESATAQTAVQQQMQTSKESEIQATTPMQSLTQVSVQQHMQIQAQLQAQPWEHVLTQVSSEAMTGTVKLFQNGLPKEFVTPRPPEEGGIRFKDGNLVLKASACPLSTVNARNILLRRQGAFCFRAEAELIVPALSEEQEAGITCYYDENTWVCFFVSRDGKSYFLQVKEHIGKEDIVHTKKELADSVDLVGKRIILGVNTRYLHRSFYYNYNNGMANDTSNGAINGTINDTSKGTLNETLSAALNGAEGKEKVLEELPNVYYLCDEGISMGKRFTGAMVGMYGYAGGSGVEEGEPLYIEFEDFRYWEA